MTQQNNPFLEGNFAPWLSEDTFDNLEVEGKIPADLNGTLLRNGPNPQFDPAGPYHWFNGDGMLHAIRIQNGRASYNNQWVRTERFKLEKEAGCTLYDATEVPDDFTKRIQETARDTANTNIVSYNGNLLALNEGSVSHGIKLDDLSTIGPYTYQGQIERPLSAHPRYDYARKEVMTYSYLNQDGSLHYYRLNKDNQVIAKNEIYWPYPAMLHDFANTENYVIFPLFPCTFSFERIMRGESFFMWEGDQLPTWFIITDKNGEEVGRIETDPCYAYHFGNAFEQGNDIIIDAMVSPKTSLMPDRNGQITEDIYNKTCYARWVINLSSKKISLTYLDRVSVEFPRFDERFNGLPYNYLYVAGCPEGGEFFDRIITYQAGTGNKEEFLFGEDIPWEPVFVPRSDKEGDGYLLTVVYRTKEDRSDVVILDAQHVSDGPIATIKIPHRIPYGFHGNFIT